MNKADFVKHVAQQHQCTKTEAEKTIDIFTSSVIDAISKSAVKLLKSLHVTNLNLRLVKSLKMQLTQSNARLIITDH